MELLPAIAAIVMLVVLALLWFASWVYTMGVIDTEQRWSDAVKKAEDRWTYQR